MSRESSPRVSYAPETPDAFIKRKDPIYMLASIEEQIIQVFSTRGERFEARTLHNGAYQGYDIFFVGCVGFCCSGACFVCIPDSEGLAVGSAVELKGHTICLGPDTPVVTLSPAVD